MNRHRRFAGLLALALTGVVAFPVAAIGQGSAVPTAAQVAKELEGLVRLSVEGAIPTGQYGKSPRAQKISGGTEDLSSTISSGELHGEIVITIGELRSVAQVEGEVCPDAQGVVSLKIRMSLGSPTGSPRAIEAAAGGSADDDARLTSPSSTVVTGKGQDAAVLKQLGMALLRQAERGWRRGMCVKVEVTEGQSRIVTPKEKVSISASAKPRAGGTDIKKPMTSKLVAGAKKVAPRTSSDSPAKFNYTAPDKHPEFGSVELKSVSRRGIGIATLMYSTTGYKLEKTSPEGFSLKGTKCDGVEGEWTFEGALNSSGLNTRVVYSITISTGSLAGTYEMSNITNVPGLGDQATVSALGDALLVPQKDGSIIMKLAASESTAAAAGAGTQQATQVTFPAQSFHWKAGDALSCADPN